MGAAAVPIAMMAGPALAAGISGAMADEETRTPFEGEVWWPYLDFGALSVDKELESLDLAVTGEVSVSFGYDERRTNLATAGYVIDGDTLPGTPIPFPLTAPSLQLRLTFSASQSWEWSAAALHLVK